MWHRIQRFQAGKVISDDGKKYNEFNHQDYFSWINMYLDWYSDYRWTLFLFEI